MLLIGAGLVLPIGTRHDLAGAGDVPEPGGRHRRARAGVLALGRRPGRAERAGGRRRAAAGGVQPAAARPPSAGALPADRRPARPGRGVHGDRVRRAHRPRGRSGRGTRRPSRWLAVLLSLALASVLSTIAGAVLGPGSRRGHDVGTIVTAVALSVVAVAATLLPALDTAFRRGSVPWLADALTWLPTGWGPVAVQAAAHGDWLAVVGSLAGLACSRRPRRLVAGGSQPADGRGRAACPRGRRAARAAGRRCRARRPGRSPPRRSGCGCATRSG